MLVDMFFPSIVEENGKLRVAGNLEDLQDPENYTG